MAPHNPTLGAGHPHHNHDSSTTSQPKVSTTSTQQLINLLDAHLAFTLDPDVHSPPTTPPPPPPTVPHGLLFPPPTNTTLSQRASHETLFLDWNGVDDPVLRYRHSVHPVREPEPEPALSSALLLSSSSSSPPAHVPRRRIYRGSYHDGVTGCFARNTMADSTARRQTFPHCYYDDDDDCGEGCGYVERYSMHDEYEYGHEHEHEQVCAPNRNHNSSYDYRSTSQSETSLPSKPRARPRASSVRCRLRRLLARVFVGSRR